MKETYRVARPDRIVWGDPWYMEKYSGKNLENLIVDFQPPKRFEARVTLEQMPMEEYPDIMLNTMTIFLAPKETMETYMKDMMYESQQHTVKEIGVDTAQYLLQVDENDNVIHTGGDGYWGNYQEMFRMIGERKVLDAAIVTIGMSEYETMDSMRDYLKYFFKDVEQTENVEMAEDASEEQQEEPQQNM